MPVPARKPILFIGYSHLDEPERPREGEVRRLSFVVRHLRPAEKHGAVEIWLDRLMEGGADWEREIGPCGCRRRTSRTPVPRLVSSDLLLGASDGRGVDRSG
jgi:hypothetical protein